MEKENITSQEETPEVENETKHEPHQHARPRLLIGIAAIVVVALMGFIWSRWGETIKEVCFGEDGACPVELPDTPMEGDTALFEDTTFDTLEEGDTQVARAADSDIVLSDLPPLPEPPSVDILNEIE